MSENWLRRMISKPEAKFRLFCFSGTGGSGLMYARMFQDMDVEVAPIDYPGRYETDYSRTFGTPIENWEEMVQALADLIEVMTEKPFIFYGFSLGGRLCYNVACELKQRGGPVPQVLFLSGCAPFSHRLVFRNDLDKFPSEMEEHEFWHYMKEKWDLPFRLMNNVLFRKAFDAQFRSDWRISESVDYDLLDAAGWTEPLDIPLVVYSGRSDLHYPPSIMEGWKHYSLKFRICVFNGGHGLAEYSPTISQEIIRDMSNELSLLP